MDNESHGKPEAAIIDIVDHRLLRAVRHYHARKPRVDANGLPDESLSVLPDLQARYDLVVAHLIAGSVSLGRAAELLDLSWLDLRTRCMRLELPLPVAPASPAEILADAETALRWSASNQA